MALFHLDSLIVMVTFRSLPAVHSEDMGLLGRISDISESTNQQCLEQLSHHINNHDAAIFLRTSALLRGHMKGDAEPLSSGERPVRVKYPQILGKVAPKLYMKQLYEVYAKRGSEKTNQYYNDMAQQVKDEDAACA